MFFQKWLIEIPSRTAISHQLASDETALERAIWWTFDWFINECSLLTIAALCWVLTLILCRSQLSNQPDEGTVNDAIVMLRRSPGSRTSRAAIERHSAYRRLVSRFFLSFFDFIFLWFAFRCGDFFHLIWVSLELVYIYAVQDCIFNGKKNTCMCDW